MQETGTKENIVFVDGYCILCNGFADFVMRYDRKFRFHIATIQGETFKSVQQQLISQKEIPDSIIIKIGERYYSRSTGVLNLLGMLPFPLNVLKVFMIIPRILRDPVYNLVARNRYQWFGKRTSCRMPDNDDQQRFLG